MQPGIQFQKSLESASNNSTLKRWFTDQTTKHFKNLLGKEPKLPDDISLPRERVSEDLDISTSEFTLPELHAVLKHTKTSKAFGPDNIPPILWKDPEFHSILLEYCNHAFISSVCPKVWPTSQIVICP